MDAVAEATVELELFRRNPVIYVHCVDFTSRFELALSGFPILRLKCVYGHVSFPSDLTERRIVVFPDSEVLSQFQNVRSPCCVSVKSSALFDVLPEETEDNNDARIVVIWKFEFEASMSATASAVCPIEKPADSMFFMPRLDFKNVVCNCSKYPNVESVLVHVNSREETTNVSELMGNLSLSFDTDTGSHSDIESERESDSDEPEIHEDSSGSQELCTEVMRMKGSSYHDHFQSSLRICKELLLKKNEPVVRFSFEPTNKRDENAIVLQSKLDGKWLPIGYVPAPKVPKVTRALKNGELKTVTLKNVFYQYIYALNDFRYFPSVAVSKVGNWPKNNPNYQYNDKIL